MGDKFFMKIIVGLGNPENKYKNTRHNVGFEVINEMSKDYNIKIDKVKFKAHVGEGFINGEKIILIKPQTFMNLSGLSVKEALNFYKSDIENLIVISDDVSLPVGAVRIRKKGSAGGHNGLKDIISRLSTEEFLRVKIGVGEKPEHYILGDYVLSKFTKTEDAIIQDTFSKASDCVGAIIKKGADYAMNNFNG